MQAIGSLGAVLAAVGIVGWQLRHERQREKDKTFGRLKVLGMLVYHCRVELSHAAAAFQSFQPSGFLEPSGLRHKIATLREIPAFEFPDTGVAVAVLTAVQAYDDFSAGTTGSQHSNAYRHLRYASNIEAHLNAAVANFGFAERFIRGSLHSLNSALDDSYSINGTQYPPLDP